MSIGKWIGIAVIMLGIGLIAFSNWRSTK